MGWARYFVKYNRTVTLQDRNTPHPQASVSNITGCMLRLLFNHCHLSYFRCTFPVPFRVSSTSHSLLARTHSSSIMSTPKQPSIMEMLAAAMKSGPAQKRDDEFYKPRPQEYFVSNKDAAWEAASTVELPRSNSSKAIDPQTVRLISWNIDMLVPFGDERMTAALTYLQTLVSSTPAETPIVIFLQEMTPSDLALITSSSWIRERFNISDKDNSAWLSPYYGTVTLVDARLSIASVFRVPFLSKFDRDGLFVDIVLSPSSKVPSSASQSPKVLRLCDVHLESLVANPPVRPAQLSAAAEYLRAPEVACALLAGDLNAIEPFDRTLHHENGLQDAYLELGGREDDEEGYTWGYQVPRAMREQFGCSRMDKIFFRGDISAKKFERIGVGAKVDEDVKQGVRMGEDEEWVSDHYGVMGDFVINEGWTLKDSEGGVAGRPKLS